MSKELSEKTLKLESIIRNCFSAVVSFSGGVDSSVVCAATHKCLGENAVAVTAVSPIFPPKEIEVAKKVAKLIGIRHLIIKTNELNDPNFTSNPANRCYHCKIGLLRKLEGIRNEYGFERILDGTNSDDLFDYRPGMFAAEEFKVISPLALAGITKEETRKIAASYGLPDSDKPANSCLATRIPFGHEITLDKLQRIAAAEEFVRSLGFRIVRVRDNGNLALVEVDKTELTKALKSEEKIAEHLKGWGYASVEIDLQGYRSGYSLKKFEIER